MGSRSEPEWMVYVVAAALVLPALMPAGLFLKGNPEAALVSLLAVCAVFPLQALAVGLLILSR